MQGPLYSRGGHGLTIVLQCEESLAILPAIHTLGPSRGASIETSGRLPAGTSFSMRVNVVILSRLGTLSAVPDQSLERLEG